MQSVKRRDGAFPFLSEVSGIIDAADGLSFSQPQFVLMVHKDYSDWLYNGEKGACGEFNPRIPLEEILIPNSKQLDFFAMTAKGKNVPALLFTDCKKNPQSKVSLYNTVQQGRARAINYLVNTYSSHESFHVRFGFIKKPQLNATVTSMIQSTLASRSIASGPLQIFFEEDKIKMLYKGNEVTEGAGFLYIIAV